MQVDRQGNLDSNHAGVNGRDEIAFQQDNVPIHTSEMTKRITIRILSRGSSPMSFNGKERFSREG